MNGTILTIKKVAAYLKVNTAPSIDLRLVAEFQHLKPVVHGIPANKSSSNGLIRAYPVVTHTKLETPLPCQILGKTGAASVC